MLFWSSLLLNNLYAQTKYGGCHRQSPYYDILIRIMRIIPLLFCVLVPFLTATSQDTLTIWRNNVPLDIPIAEIDSITFKTATPQGIGVFSVASNRAVAFSRGNLQYIPTADTWLFAVNQYDYIGTRNMVDQAFADTIDLFAWSTNTDPSTAWGATLVEDNDLYTGDFVDWGTAIGDGNTWRTLTSAEWEYIRAKRPNASELLGVGSVDGMHGLILLPDNWVSPNGITFKSGYSDQEYSAIAFEEYQSFTVEQWNVMQSAGAVFLPCAGFRIGTSLAYMQMAGLYWTSSPQVAYGPRFASYFLFMCDGAGIGYDLRSGANAVRLVCNL